MVSMVKLSMTLPSGPRQFDDNPAMPMGYTTACQSRDRDQLRLCINFYGKHSSEFILLKLYPSTETVEIELHSFANTYYLKFN